MSKFRKTFQSPYQQYNHRVGDKFKVIRELADEEKDPEVGKMYLIEFEDGEQIAAWPEEVEEDIDVSPPVEDWPQRGKDW